MAEVTDGFDLSDIVEGVPSMMLEAVRPSKRMGRESGHFVAPSGDCASRLYLELQPFITNCIRRLTANPDFRQDLAGESYLIYSRLIERFEPSRGIPLRPYLISQMRCHLYSRVRSQWAVSRRETTLAAVDAYANRCGSAWDDPSRQWDDVLELRRIAAHVLPMLNEISVRQRRTIVWRYFDGLSYEEIADRLGVRPATVRSLVRHGLARLRIIASKRPAVSLTCHIPSIHVDSLVYR